jgi:hypothetical protein
MLESQPPVTIVLAPVPRDEESLDLVGVTHSVASHRGGWTVELPSTQRGRAAQIRILPVFADVDAVPYFIEVARMRRYGQDWQPIPRNEAGVFVLDPLTPFDPQGLALELEAVPQATAQKPDVAGKPKRRPPPGGITIKDAGGGGR